MALQPAGLKTHIWNNQIKSAPILICYPSKNADAMLRALMKIEQRKRSHIRGFRTAYDPFEETAEGPGTVK